MFIMADGKVGVYGGVDAHKDVHVAAAVDQAGRLLGVASFAADPAGYVRLREWLSSLGPLVRVGVEGTGSYGAGLARHLADAGIEAVEVVRPNRQMRRRRGKSDVVDAESAARAALSGEAAVVPKSNDGIVESIRQVRVALCSTRDHLTRVSNQIRDLTLTAPDALRSELEPLTTAQRVARCARFRPGDVTDPAQAAKLALRTLARQHQTLEGDLAELRGASPVEASSGRTVRHRLNPGGDRQANHALWRIAMVRLATCERTRSYAARRQAQGKTRRETIRCLKRYIAREVFALLTKPQTVPAAENLRAQRHATGHSLATAAAQLGTWPATISAIERGHAPHHRLTDTYRHRLNNQQTAA